MMDKSILMGFVMFGIDLVFYIVVMVEVIECVDLILYEDFVDCNVFGG